MLLSYKPLHLEDQQRLQGEGCVVDIKLFSGTLSGRLVLEGIYLDLAIEYFSFLFITSLVYKRKLQKMELSLSHTLHLFNIFRENDGKENCAQVLEEECIKMFGTKSLNDEHDCNVVSMNSLNIHDANDMQSHN